MLIFLHIPKAAGNTFIQILAKHYNDSQTLRALGVDHIWQVVASLSPSEKRTIRCICGHLRYGIHKAFSQRSDYVTFLREPVSRILSFYYYIIKTPAHYLHKSVVNGGLSLDDFVQSNLTDETTNLQTVLISGCDGKVSGDSLEIAKRRLKEDFLAFGLSEHFDASLLLLSKALGWSWRYYTRQNVSANYDKAKALNDDTLALIKEHNRYDLELYDFAKEVFLSSIEKYGNNFYSDLRVFKKNNRKHQRLYGNSAARLVTSFCGKAKRWVVGKH